jgi:hypothetical protein
MAACGRDPRSLPLGKWPWNRRERIDYEQKNRGLLLPIDITVAVRVTAAAALALSESPALRP